MRSLEDDIATPMLWYPGMCDEERAYEITRMVERSLATRAFMNGEISWDDLMDVLNDHRIDVNACLEDWENGIFYI